MARQVVRELKTLRDERGLTTVQMAEAFGVDECDMARFQETLKWFEHADEAGLLSVLRYATAAGFELQITVRPLEQRHLPRRRREYSAPATRGELPELADGQSDMRRAVCRRVIADLAARRIERGLTTQQVAAAICRAAPNSELNEVEVEQGLDRLAVNASDASLSTLRLYAHAVDAELVMTANRLPAPPTRVSPGSV